VSPRSRTVIVAFESLQGWPSSSGKGEASPGPSSRPAVNGQPASQGLNWRYATRMAQTIATGDPIAARLRVWVSKPVLDRERLHQSDPDTIRSSEREPGRSGQQPVELSFECTRAPRAGPLCSGHHQRPPTATVLAEASISLAPTSGWPPGASFQGAGLDVFATAEHGIVSLARPGEHQGGVGHQVAEVARVKASPCHQAPGCGLGITEIAPHWGPGPQYRPYSQGQGRPLSGCDKSSRALPGVVVGLPRRFVPSAAGPANRALVSVSTYPPRSS